jgi:photosystem II stability/assembly factor-like uncharacterized protein
LNLELLKMSTASTFYAVIVAVFIAACSGNIQENNPASKTNNPNGRNDDWGFAGYGGGGAMFYPAVSPHNPDYVLVACDMTGSFVTRNAGTSWRMFNLRGPVDYFVYDPLDSNTVYANSIGLFKSTDRGNTWALFYPQPSEVVGVVSIGDHASEVIATKDNTRRHVQAFAVDPTNSQRLFAAISVDRTVAFFVSENGGGDWRKEKDLDSNVQNIFIVPSSPENNRTIYVTAMTGVTRKENGHWKTSAPPAGVQQFTQFTGGFDKEKNQFMLYAISGESYFNPDVDLSGIYYSEDGGVSWENRQQGLLDFRTRDAGYPEWRTIATSALNPHVVYVSYNNLKTHEDTTSLGVARSDDYGKTWTLTWKDQLTPKGNTVSSNYESGWINPRFGPTWGENPFSLGVSPADPNVCYGTDFGRTTKTEDGGKTWKQVYTKKSKTGGGWTSTGLEVTTSYAIVFDPFDTSHVFIANTDVGLMESIDGAKSWRSATQNNGIPRAWLNSTYWLTFDPKVKGKAWAAMSGTHDLPRPKMFRRNGTSEYKGGLVMTEDGGKTWTAISADIGEGAMTHILIDEKSDPASRTLYACAFGKGVYKSVDGGKTWQQKNNGIESKEPFAWRIIQRGVDDALFLIVCRRSEDGSIGNDGDGALYRSDDRAETWARVALPQGTNGPMSLVIDSEDPKRILLSAWGKKSDGKFSPDTGGGIFLSEDDAKTWQNVLGSDQHIHDITFDARSVTYYACGFNGAAYRSDDAGQSWERIKGYNFKWGKRVDPDPRDPEKIFIITFGGGVWYGSAKGDPDAVEDISPALSVVPTSDAK